MHYLPEETPTDPRLDELHDKLDRWGVPQAPQAAGRPRGWFELIHRLSLLRDQREALNRIVGELHVQLDELDVPAAATADGTSTLRARVGVLAAQRDRARSVADKALASVATLREEVVYTTQQIAALRISGEW